MQKKFVEQFRSGQSLTGKGGAFAPLLKQFLEAVREVEPDSHLKEEKEEGHSNRCNGRTSKKVKSADEVFELETSRDRKGSFEPSIVKKRETILADRFSDRIIGMYGLGMSLLDIASHIREIYDMDISHETLSNIIDRVMPMVRAWQSRPLEEFYCITWLDAIHYKVRDDGRAKSRAVYNVLGINKEGCKELMGGYVSESESATFWL